MTRRLLCWLLCLPLLIGQALAQTREFDDIIDSGFLKVAVYNDFAPYSYREDGEPRGIDVVLARTLTEKLGVSLELIWMMPGEKLDDDLRNYIWLGHYLRKQEIADLMLRVPYDRAFSYKRNELGEVVNELVVMFGPYQRERWLVAHDTRRLEEVPSVAVFGYHPIGVEIDSVPSFYMTSVFGGRMSANTHHFHNPGQAFAAMQKGEVDAVMAMRGEVEHLLHKTGDPQLKPGVNAYPEMGRQYWDIGMAVHEANRQLAYAVDDVIEDLIRSGEMERIYQAEGLTYELPGLYQEVQ
ncbi:substrate-binding periplasmic protein [Stutzerimonas tarimensis]|uniref:Substrate-binding periplasmic protein n=1 Tax=Stutzerimonas tarimensis TaxID=1507735 RepID=A0ABV7T471_9GAMM